MLNFARLREINTKRLVRWHGDDWPLSTDPWSLADWSNAMAGEAGEACNVVKKLRRWETGSGAGPGCYPGCLYERASIDGQEVVSELHQALKDELADVILYTDILAAKAGIDLEAAVRSKFNRKSIEQGFPERL